MRLKPETPGNSPKNSAILLLQVLFHADLAREAGTFDISDVITGIHNKMIRRHPHVFGDVKAETAGEVLKNWAQLKAREKQVAAGLRDIPTERPCLVRARRRSTPPSSVARSLPAYSPGRQRRIRLGSRRRNF